MVSPHEDPIELVDSQYAAWRARYDRDRLERLFDRRDLRDAVYRIEHVGSTAVPGLAAKDVVDLDIVVADRAVGTVLRRSNRRSVALDTKIRRWHPVFRFSGGQRFNDHVFGRSGPGWRVSVATTRVLRERPALRERNERLKRRKAAETDDLETYSEAKSAIISELLDEARTFDFDFDIPALGSNG